MSSGGYGVGMSQDIPPWQKSCPKCKSTAVFKIKFGFIVDRNAYDPRERLNCFAYKCETCKLVSFFDESY